MKKITSLFFLLTIFMIIAAGCGSKLKDQKWVLDKKHQPFPDYVLNTPTMVQETYIMASTYPEVVASVPCYCGCKDDGHKSNLDCFVHKMGDNNAVTEWDPHGIA